MVRLLTNWRRWFVLLCGAIIAVTPVGGGKFVPSRVFGAQSAAAAGCAIAGPTGSVQHVIYIQFDNTHFLRDNPNVPSDLEQMPHLLNFIQNNGTLLTNHHTPLISHTATDILTSLTGLYPDRMGMPIANSYRYFNPDGSSNPAVSFAYWTDPIYDPTGATPTDPAYTMVTPTGQNTPAPWVPYTRAGCDVGQVAVANTVLENTATDIPTVFGANSPQAAEVKSSPAQAFADFVGIGVHCARGSSLCSAANGGQPDRLPGEPGGYGGYLGLFGHKYVAPQISPSGPLVDLNGATIQDSKGNVGFPGFDGMSAAVSLGYVAAMQEHGIPVTYAYISDAHDNHTSATAYGPGEAGYEAQLQSYDSAFATFFARLQKDGINQSNTLFVFTADEGDHFVGGQPSPSNCDGVNVPCAYNQIGELNGNLAGLLATQQNVTTKFSVHSDSAPNFYVAGNPGPASSSTRGLERAVSNLTAPNPMTGANDSIAQYLADPVEMKNLHMVSGDPQRTPTFTLFADPNYYLFAGAQDCSKPCVTQQAAFAWNHGDVQQEIATTWAGFVGPGVSNLGQTDAVWTDHTDLRPTMLALVGQADSYFDDGRVITELMADSALPAGVKSNAALFARLASTYKQLNAPVGRFGLDTLRASTTALRSNSTGDATYASIESQLAALGAQRDGVAGQINAVLEASEFYGQPLNTTDARRLLGQAQALLSRADALATQQ